MLRNTYLERYRRELEVERQRELTRDREQLKQMLPFASSGMVFSYDDPIFD